LAHSKETDKFYKNRSPQNDWKGSPYKISIAALTYNIAELINEQVIEHCSPQTGYPDWDFRDFFFNSFRYNWDNESNYSRGRFLPNVFHLTRNCHPIRQPDSVVKYMEHKSVLTKY
jgi:hypothetical protein